MSAIDKEPLVDVRRGENVPIVVADGIFVNVELDVAKLLFFEDQTYPKHDVTDPSKVTFGNRLRVIKFEVRMPTRVMANICGAFNTTLTTAKEALLKGATLWIVTDPKLRITHAGTFPINQVTKEKVEEMNDKYGKGQQSD